MKKQIQNLGRIHDADIVAVSGTEVLASKVYGTMQVEIPVIDENGEITGAATESREFEDNNISFGIEHVVDFTEAEKAELPTIEAFVAE